MPLSINPSINVLESICTRKIHSWESNKQKPACRTNQGKKGFKDCLKFSGFTCSPSGYLQALLEHYSSTSICCPARREKTTLLHTDGSWKSSQWCQASWTPWSGEGRQMLPVFRWSFGCSSFAGALMMPSCWEVFLCAFAGSLQGEKQSQPCSWYSWGCADSPKMRLWL